MPPPMSDLKQQIVDLRRQGHRPAEIARLSGHPINRVRYHLQDARDRYGVVFPPLHPESARRYVHMLAARRAIRCQGGMREVLDTLTCAQVDKLLDMAPRAETFAQALAIYLAQRLPEKEYHD